MIIIETFAAGTMPRARPSTTSIANEPSQGAAQRQLLRLLTNLFEVGRDA
jgi:hypothetical protein